MKKLSTNVWNKLNGKKTLLGLFLAVLYTGLVSQGILERNASVEWLITAVTGVGIGHKIVKS